MKRFVAVAGQKCVMTLALTILWVPCFWLVVHSFKYLSKRSKPILPLSRSRRRVDVIVKNLHLRVKTQAFNRRHNAISNILASNDRLTTKRTLLLLYDLGSVIAMIGMVIALALLGVMAVNLLVSVAKIKNKSTLGALVKRGLENDSGDGSPASTIIPRNTLSVQPIIPGVTVPLGHFPIIFLALCLCQIAHESGHAIAAALRQVPILSAGFSITVIFPSAFVVFPAVHLGELPAVDRLRILASGCFHNFLFWFFLVLVMWTRVAAIFSRIMFNDFSSLGKVVVDISSDSPLWAHVPPGTIITRLDDTSLRVTADSPNDDLWQEFLLSPSIPAPSHGWCVESTSLANGSTLDECLSSDGHFCFVATDGLVHYNMDPIPIFIGNVSRCKTSSDCTTSWSCIALRQDQQLVRITLMNALDDQQEQVVVWSGPRREIWEQVEVSVLSPRIPFISHKFLRYAVDLLEYIKSINLSLYLVNMLPIPSLDGDQFLLVLLELILNGVPGTGILDLEAVIDDADGRVTHRRRVQLRMLVERVLTMTTFVLIVLCVLLAAIKHALG